MEAEINSKVTCLFPLDKCTVVLASGEIYNCFLSLKLFVSVESEDDYGDYSLVRVFK